MLLPILTVGRQRVEIRTERSGRYDPHDHNHAMNAYSAKWLRRAQYEGEQPDHVLAKNVMRCFPHRGIGGDAFEPAIALPMNRQRAAPTRTNA